MTSYRYQLNVSQDFHQLSSCLQNNRLLSGFLSGGEEHSLVKREEGTARSCSDPLSFASFLAFALAVANLMMGNGRRRRSSSENSCIHRDLKEDLIMSTSTIVTGVVFSYDQCSGE